MPNVLPPDNGSPDPIIPGHCVFQYLYRDASNYKVHGELLLEGDSSPDAIDRLIRALQAGEFFIPAQVLMPPLSGALFAYSNGPTEDDHPWHEFVDLRPATPDEIVRLKPDRTLSELLAQFASVRRWNPNEG